MKNLDNWMNNPEEDICSRSRLHHLTLLHVRGGNHHHHFLRMVDKIYIDDDDDDDDGIGLPQVLFLGRQH